jgi:hypothetical protein
MQDVLDYLKEAYPQNIRGDAFESGSITDIFDRIREYAY